MRENSIMHLICHGGCLIILVINEGKKNMLELLIRLLQHKQKEKSDKNISRKQYLR